MPRDHLCGAVQLCPSPENSPGALACDSLMPSTLWASLPPSHSRGSRGALLRADFPLAVVQLGPRPSPVLVHPKVSSPPERVQVVRTVPQEVHSVSSDRVGLDVLDHKLCNGFT